MEALTLQMSASGCRAASRLGSPPSTMTTLVDRLATSGLFRRSSTPDDRRLVVLEATDAGHSAIASSTSSFDAGQPPAGPPSTSAIGAPCSTS